MLPEIPFFSLSLSTYGLCVAVGLILMGLTAYTLSRKHYIALTDIVFGEISALLGAFIGAHILYGITNINYIINDLTAYFSGNIEFDALIVNFSYNLGGMVFYGGLLGGIAFGVIYCKIRRIDPGIFSDVFAVGIPLFHCFGRIGCFMSGCCYGIESSFGFTARDALIDSCNNVPRFPVQLLESSLNLIIFAVLLLLFRKGIMQNRLIYVYLIMYGIVRFFDECLRGDEYRGFLLGLSTSQWISAILVIISVIILILKYKPAQKCYIKKW